MTAYTIIASEVTEDTGYTAAADVTLSIGNTGSCPMVLMQGTTNPGNTSAGIPLNQGAVIAYPVKTGNKIYIRGTAGQVLAIAP